MKKECKYDWFLDEGLLLDWLTFLLYLLQSVYCLKYSPKYYLFSHVSVIDGGRVKRKFICKFQNWIQNRTKKELISIITLFKRLLSFANIKYYTTLSKKCHHLLATEKNALNCNIVDGFTPAKNETEEKMTIKAKNFLKRYCTPKKACKFQFFN